MTGMKKLTYDELELISGGNGDIISARDIIKEPLEVIGDVPERKSKKNRFFS